MSPLARPVRDRPNRPVANRYHPKLPGSSQVVSQPRIQQLAIGLNAVTSPTVILPTTVYSPWQSVPNCKIPVIEPPF